MNAKKYVKYIAVFLAFLCCLGAVLAVTENTLKDKKGAAKYEEYFENPDQYDVLFLGTSHSVMAYLPMELWKEYGIYSYNLSNYGQEIATDYWVLREALEESKPKVVVVDAYYLASENKYSSQHLLYLHQIFDELPLSKTKIEAVLDIYPEDLQAEFLLPFSVNHSRWDKLEESSFEGYREEYCYGKGSDENAFIERPATSLIYSTTSLNESFLDTATANMEETVGVEYTRKIIELCQEEGIEVVLSIAPYQLQNEEEAGVVKRAELLAEEYDVLFFSEFTEHVIDPVTDLWDDDHLNSLGARKWTSAFGEYLIENLGSDIVRDEEDSKEYEEWNSFYNGEYMSYKISKLVEQENIYNYLLLASDPNLAVDVIIPEGSSVYDDAGVMALLSNIDLDAFDADLIYDAGVVTVDGEVVAQTGADIPAMIVVAMNRIDGTVVDAKIFDADYVVR